jgi:hypothetical protein
MTIDISDLDLDEELALLAQDLYEQLAERGDALIVHRPSAPNVDTHPPRRRSRRAWGLVAAAAASALVVVSVVAIGRGSTAPSDVAAEGSTTTATPTEPWRLTLDPASGFQLAYAFEADPKSSGSWQNVDGTMVPIRTVLSVWSAPDQPLMQPPLLAIETTSQTEPVERFPGTEPIAIDGRPGSQSPPIDGVTVMRFQIDDTHIAQVAGWGIDAAEMTRLLAGSTVRGDGRVVLTQEPATLARHDVPDAAATAIGAVTNYVAGGTAKDGPSVSLGVRQEPNDGEVAREMVSGIFGTASMRYGDPASEVAIEPLTVRGQAAVQSTQTHSGGLTFSMITWAEPVSGRTVVLSTMGMSRDETRALVDHLVPIDAEAWRQLLQRCPQEPAPGEVQPAC